MRTLPQVPLCVPDPLPFLGQEELEKIFGRAMLEDLSLRETLTSWWELSVRNLLSAWEAETRSGKLPG